MLRVPDVHHRLINMQLGDRPEGNQSVLLKLAPLAIWTM
jgi:hypothetical protein